jgi:hypothetical protein
MKLLFVVSSLDLTQPFSATPAWWQLLKGLYEIGVEVIAAPYQGPAQETLWWRAEKNPAQWQGDAFKAARDGLRRLRRAPARADAPPPSGEALADRASREAARRLVAPLWERHLSRILTREPDIDAVIFVTVPLNHLVGVAAAIERRHGKPVFYYDGDVPASLPGMGGFATGFRMYQGANPGEFTAFLSNSKGGEAALLALGARAAHTLYYGADPDVFRPLGVSQDLDVFFYGHGREYRDEWIDAMIAAPARALPEARFAVRGRQLGDLGRVEQLPYLSICASRARRTPGCTPRRHRAHSSWRAWAAPSSPIPTWASRSGSSRAASCSSCIPLRRRWTACAICWRTMPSAARWAKRRARACCASIPSGIAQPNLWRSCARIWASRRIRRLARGDEQRALFARQGVVEAELLEEGIGGGDRHHLKHMVDARALYAGVHQPLADAHALRLF